MLFKGKSFYKEENETPIPSRYGSVLRNAFYSTRILFLIVSTPYNPTRTNISSHMDFFTNRIEVFDTVDHNTLLRGASSFLTCFRHFQWSKSVLTLCFNVTRFVLGSSLLLRSQKYICRGESSLLVSNFTRVSKKVKRGKILVAGLWVYRLTTPQPVLNKL